jgi:hypothetical protein
MALTHASADHRPVGRPLSDIDRAHYIDEGYLVLPRFATADPTLVDATAFGTHPYPGCVDSCTMQFGIYQLPATGFLVGFLVIGWWLLATFVAEHVRTRHVAADVGQPEARADMADDTASVADSPREPLPR